MLDGWSWVLVGGSSDSFHSIPIGVYWHPSHDRSRLLISTGIACLSYLLLNISGNFVWKQPWTRQIISRNLIISSFGAAVNAFKRFFLFHFLFPFLLCGFRILHLFYLHFLSSNNPLRNSTNNKIPFFPFILQKDFFGLILALCLYFLQTHFGVSSFSSCSL